MIKPSGRYQSLGMTTVLIWKRACIPDTHPKIGKNMICRALKSDLIHHSISNACTKSPAPPFQKPADGPVIWHFSYHMSYQPESETPILAQGSRVDVACDMKMPYHNLFIIYYNASFFIFVRSDRFQKPWSVIWDMIQ